MCVLGLKNIVIPAQKFTILSFICFNGELQVCNLLIYALNNTKFNYSVHPFLKFFTAIKILIFAPLKNKTPKA